jgi:hypothetical protein
MGELTDALFQGRKSVYCKTASHTPPDKGSLKVKTSDWQ